MPFFMFSQRASDGVFNVKDYGAVGDGSHDDTTAIQAAFDAMHATTARGSILFFPSGQYKVSGSGVDINNYNSGASGGGVICGAGKEDTLITGNIPNGFVFNQVDGAAGPSGISNLTLSNSSNVIGSGAFFLNNSIGALYENCNFKGAIGVLMPANIYQSTFLNCSGAPVTPHPTTGYTGTFGIAGVHASVIGWRSTATFDTWLCFNGANTAVIEACGVENCATAWIAGMGMGWASACTASGTTLSVGGKLGAASAQFRVGGEVLMQGVTTTADWGISPMAATRCFILSQLSGTPGQAGTYQLSRSVGTISSPVPALCRFKDSISGTRFGVITTEACRIIGFATNAAGCVFDGLGGGSTVVECVGPTGSPSPGGYAATAGIWIYTNCNGTVFQNCAMSNNPTLASWYFDPNGGGNHLTFVGCTGQKVQDVVTGTSSSITNGSGGAGTILDVLSIASGTFVGIGCRVFVSGVQVTTIIGNGYTDGTLTGGSGTGTYRTADPLNVTGQAITIKWGDDWVMPTVSSDKTALQFVNCTSPNLPAGYTTGLDSLNRTFTSLPGQAGANTNFPVVKGMEYTITDSNTATWGATAAGGGSNNVAVRYNGTNWTVVGK